jgi:GNAT superfamily N-acetyltransferase
MVEAIVSVYQQSFGGEPWNEVYLCPVCGKDFPHHPVLTTCPLCAERGQQVLVVDYWPRYRVVSDFYKEMRKPSPVCVTAEMDGGVVGFAWGYQVSATESLDEHLDAPGLHQSLHGDYFYLDECALTPQYQGKGIGKRLVTKIFEEQATGRILLRTMRDSRMHRIIEHMGGEIVQYISRDRIIMILILK